MFKTRNNQSTLANQQLLDEIELMSGQEMVELDSQELMNVVGGKNQPPENSSFIVIGVNGENQVDVPQQPGGTLVVDPLKNPPVMATPAT